MRTIVRISRAADSQKASFMGLSRLIPSPVRTAWWLARQRSLSIRPWEALANEEALRGRSIALVGNAGYLTQLEQGPTIDSYDVIVRMNNFRVAGFERQVGARLDLFLSNFYDDIDLQRPILGTARWLVASAPNNFTRGNDPRLKGRHGEGLTAGLLKLGRTAAFAPSRKYFGQWLRQIGGYPTTGAAGILLVLDHLLPVCGSVYITGFSFFEGPSHYFSNQTVAPVNHNVPREREVLAQRLRPYLKSGRVLTDSFLRRQLLESAAA